MRYAELLFLALLVLYHAVLLLPRYRRPFPANYLVFLAGMALAWNLGLEGLRWQTIPPIALLMLDLLVLFPTFATLRGSLPSPGFVSGLLGSFRLLVAFVALVLALGSAVLSIAFPLPSVELTGGLSSSLRIVRFPAAGDHQGVELHLWYPASGEMRPQPRPLSEPESWQRTRAEGGLPVFWQSYWAHLPTKSILGGRMASPKTEYPVIYAALPAGQNPEDFGYLFEDLASRGFIVAAASKLPAALPPPPPFDWSSALTELSWPLTTIQPWLEPEASLNVPANPDYETVRMGREAVHQLATEPGDPLFQAVDWSRQGLWSWGAGLTSAQKKEWGLRAVVYAGAQPGASKGEGMELWLSPDRPENGPEGRWTLVLPGLRRADLADAAYLKPYLAFFGLKSQADSGVHGVVRQYQAAFFQYTFWNSGPGTFGQTVPDLPGYNLVGH